MPSEDPIAKALGELRISIGEAEAEPSGSAAKTEVRIKKRPLTPEEGQLIVDQAATWEGTPYKAVGGASRKGADGEADCSGSTYCIYRDAGFPYASASMSTSTFEVYVVSEKSRFIEIPEIAQAQPGDILFWPGHLAVFAVFPDDEKRTSYGRAHNMWTARRPGVNYCSHPWETFRGGVVPKVYRYMIEERE